MKNTPPRRLIPLPRPGERFHTFDIVVASVWVDDEADEPTALLLTIGLLPPYYRVSDVMHTGMGWVIAHQTQHHNIVPAVRDYEARGGDY